MGKKNRKIRAEFRKNRTARTRQTDWTRRYVHEEPSAEDHPQQERISGKGDLTRRRTVIGSDADSDDELGIGVHLEVDESTCRRGRVLSVHGLTSVVQAEDGTQYRCAVRRLLKTLNTEQRNTVIAGDRVLFRPVEGKDVGKGTLHEGLIERVEPRRGTLSRTSRGRQHVLVTNVDQVLIVTSAAEPRLKPNLIDRMLVTAEKGGVRPIICVNKIDLVDAASLQPLVGVYSQLGYQVLMLSATTGLNVHRLRRALEGRSSVVAGQSGVGKSSLLNAVDDTLQLKTATVSQETEKGRHTTTTAVLLPLDFGGYVVDTPGIRQFELWDVVPEEVAGFYRDIRPYVSHCRYPDCTHSHEDGCSVKDAVADGKIDMRRYESYCHVAAGDLD
jgi:ribosome biogenesis GTPase